MNDKVDDFFERERAAVPLLAPPPGQLDQLQRVARKRRNRNTTAVSVAAAAVVAVVGTGGVLSVGALGHDKDGSVSTATPAGITTAAQHSAAPPTTVDAAVPSGFKAWSVSFVSAGAHGWALGEYPCATGGQCLAVLETTDGMQSWHTIAEPASAASFGVTSSSAILRFASSLDGWLVGTDSVYSTHDGGRTWESVDALKSKSIDALEALGGKVYAVGRGSSGLWVNNDATSGTWQPVTGTGLPTASAVTDTLTLDGPDVVVARSVGNSTTVRVSRDLGATWTGVKSPCKTSTTAPSYALVGPLFGRFICPDGTIEAVWLDPKHKVQRDGKFDLRSTTGSPVVALSVATNEIGTVVAYSGAGIWQLSAGLQTHQAVPGDFGYVGLSTVGQGIALPATPTGSYWVTINGGQSWIARTWN